MSSGTFATSGAASGGMLLTAATEVLCGLRMTCGSYAIPLPPLEPSIKAQRRRTRMDTNALRNGAPSWAVSLILLLCSWTVGCQTRVAAEDQQFRMMFEGFQLVLVDDLPAKTPIQELNSSVLRHTYPAERTLAPGREYAFRKTTKSSNEDPRDEDSPRPTGQDRGTRNEGSAILEGFYISIHRGAALPHPVRDRRTSSHALPPQSNLL